MADFVGYIVLNISHLVEAHNLHPDLFFHPAGGHIHTVDQQPLRSAVTNVFFSVVTDCVAFCSYWTGVLMAYVS